MTYIFQPNFVAASPDAHKIVTLMQNDLDGRLAGIKNASPDQLERVQAGFIAQGKHPFDVLLKHVPEAEKETVKDCLDCLVRAGWINRHSGKNTYQLNPDRDYGYIRVQTPKVTGKHRIETATGCVITDNSYLLRPLSDLKTLNYKKACFLEIPAPDYQLCIMTGIIEAPSRRWFSISDPEAENYTYPLGWDHFTDMIQTMGDRYGRVPFVPYETDGKKGLLTNSEKRGLFLIQNGLHRHTGRRCSPLIHVHDIQYMRVKTHPGLAQ